MFIIRNTFLAASLLGLGCFLLTGVHAGAGDKKTEEKKVDKKKKDLLNKSGELKEDDEKDAKLKEAPCQKFPIKLLAGKTYQIDLKSKDFDSFLRLEDPAGKEVASDDDGGGFPDARIVYKAVKAGEYKIVVTSFDKKAGKFTLTVAEAAPPVGNSRFQGKTIGLKLADGKASTTTDLNKQDPAFQKHFFKVFTVNLEKGKTYRIDQMDAGDMVGPLLFLEDADGNQLEMDGGRGEDARIVIKIAKAGGYRLVATSGKPAATGKFTLEIAPETDAKLLKQADLKYRINTFATLSGAQRKNLVQELSKRFQDKGEELTMADALLAFQFSVEAEMEDVDLARDVLKDYSKMFAAASNKQIAGISRQFDASLKNLEKIGKVIDIAGKTIDGKDFDLKNLKGKVVLVDFWGTWCPPCVAEIPNMAKAYEKYHKRGFDIIGISSDKDDDVVIAFMEGRQLPWPCINIEDGAKLIKENKVSAFPTPILVDQAGRVVSLRARGPQLERLLDRLLAEKK